MSLIPSHPDLALTLSCSLRRPFTVLRFHLDCPSRWLAIRFAYISRPSHHISLTLFLCLFSSLSPSIFMRHFVYDLYITIRTCHVDVD